MSKLKDFIKSIICLKRIKKKRVLFESNGPYDNGYVLFKYVANNRKDIESYFYCPQYIIKGNNPNKKIYTYSLLGKSRFARRITGILLTRLLCSCETIFESYGFIQSINKRTKHVFLGHGFGLKAAKRYMDSIYIKGYDLVFPTTELNNRYLDYYTCNNNITHICGQPRTDEIYYDVEKNARYCELVSKNSNEKTILAMITFRRYLDGKFDTSILFPSYIDLHKLNDALKTNNVRLVIKFHHVLDNADISSMDQYSNIVCLKNKDLFNAGFTPSSIIPYADGYITDYSGAASDCMLGNKPMAFFVHDIGQYNGIDQGFNVGDPLSMMPGEHITRDEQLYKFISDVSHGVDEYHDQRNKVSLIINGFINPPGDCCRRLLDIYYPLA